MSENKTKPTDMRAVDYIARIDDPRRKQEASELLALFQDATGEQAVIWGESIIGFGQYDYTYASGHSGTAAKAGFSPRKAKISLYFQCGANARPDLLEKLGPHKRAASCVYITRLDKIDLTILHEIIAFSYQTMTANYG